MVTNQYPQYYQNYPNYPNYQQYQQPIQIPQQPIQMQQQPVQMSQNQILAWIKSENDVADYPLTPGQSIFLMTQDEKFLFGKSCDQLGKTTVIKKRLVDETEGQTNKVDFSEYIRKEELENLITDMIQKEVEKRVSEISFKPTKSRKQLRDDDED